MSPMQSIVLELLFATGSSRAIISCVGLDGKWLTVAEAVAHGCDQIRNDPPDTILREEALMALFDGTDDVVVQEDVGRASPQVPRALLDRYGVRARMLAPVRVNARLSALVTLHRVEAVQPWTSADADEMRTACRNVARVSQMRAARGVPIGEDELREAAMEAVLDALRVALQVQRCTLRQDVSSKYAFPVTHESRVPGVRSLLGDFTIIQTGQPVIQKLLADRLQVVQTDTRNASDDPLFHVMLAHYSDLRAQIVTPLFRDSRMAAVLSVHSLGELREWSKAQSGLAHEAARVLGQLVGATPA